MSTQSKILIEVVSNGFVVKENYNEFNERTMIAEVQSTKVFNTKRQLNKYINENLNKIENRKIIYQI